MLERFEHKKKSEVCCFGMTLAFCFCATLPSASQSYGSCLVIRTESSGLNFLRLKQPWPCAFTVVLRIPAHTKRNYEKTGGNIVNKVKHIHHRYHCKKCRFSGGLGASWFDNTAVRA